MASSQETTGGMGKGRERTVKAIVILASVLLTLALAEVVVRLTMPKEIMRYFFVAEDPVLHHRFIPGATGRYQSPEFNTHYTINSRGLRDREIRVPKPDGTYRILMLGDSFTEGDGVELEETFSKQLERTLASSLGERPVEVINAGVGSYSPLLEYLSLRQAWLELAPDLVILNFDLSDVYDDIQYSALAVFDSAGLPVAVRGSNPPVARSFPSSALVAIKDFFKHNVRLYNVIRIRINRYLEASQHEGDFSGHIARDKYAMLRPSGDALTDSSWHRSYRYLLLIRDLLRDKGIDLWVNVYPYGLQTSPREWNQGRVFWGFKPDTLYSIEPQSTIERFCRQNGITAVNMCAPFREAARETYPLYLPDNGHWTAAGHAVVAQTFASLLIPFIREREAARAAGADAQPGNPATPGGGAK